jgi:hypothetical protein
MWGCFVGRDKVLGRWVWSNLKQIEKKKFIRKDKVQPKMY